MKKIERLKAGLKSDILNQNDTVERLRSQQSKLHSECERLREDKKQLQNKYNSLEGLNAKLMNECEMFEQRAAESEHHLMEGSKVNQRRQSLLNRRVAQMQQMLKYLTEQRASDTNKITELKLKLLQTEQLSAKKIEEIKNNYRIDKKQLLGSGAQQLNSLTQIRVLKEEKIALTNEILKLLKKNQQLQQKATVLEAESLRQEELQRYQEQKMAELTSTTRKQAAFAKVHQSRIEELGKNLALLDKQKQRLHQRLRQEAERLADMELSCNQKNASLAFLQQQNEMLRGNIQQLTIRYEEVQQLSKEMKQQLKNDADAVRDAKNQSNYLSQTIARYKRLYQKEHGECEQFRQQLNDLSKAHLALQKQHDNQSRQFLFSNEKFKSLQAEHQRVKEQFSQARSKFQAQQISLGKVSEKCRLAEKSASNLGAQLEKVVLDREQKKSEILRLQNELKLIKEEKLKLQTEIQKDALGLKEIQLDMRHKDFVIQQLRGEKARLQEQLASKKQLVMAFKLKGEESKRKILLATKKFQLLQTHFVKMRSELAGLKSRVLERRDVQQGGNILESFSSLLRKTLDSQSDYQRKESERKLNMLEKKWEYQQRTASQNRILQFRKELKQRSNEAELLRDQLGRQQEEVNLLRNENKELGTRLASINVSEDSKDNQIAMLKEKARLYQKEYTADRKQLEEEIVQLRYRLQVQGEENRRKVDQVARNLKAEVVVKATQARVEAAQVFQHQKQKLVGLVRELPNLERVRALREEKAQLMQQLSQTAPAQLIRQRA